MSLYFFTAFYFLLFFFICFNKKVSLGIIVSLLLPLIFISIFRYDVGMDYSSYQTIFNSSEIMHTNEKGYMFVNEIVKRLDLPFQVVMAIYGAITISLLVIAILENSENSRSIDSRSSSSIIASDSDESKTDSSDSYSDSKSSSSSSVSYSSFSPARCRSNSICMKPKIFSEFGHKHKHKKKNKNKKTKYNENEKSKNNKTIKGKLKSKFISKKSQPDIDLNVIKDNKNNDEQEKNIKTKEEDNNQKKIIQLRSLNETEKKNEGNNSPEKGLIRLSKVNKKDLLKHISLKHKRQLITGTYSSFFKKSYSLSILDASSDKSNGQKLSPLLIDSIKYMKYYIQIKYYKNKEMEKISKLFDNIMENKKKINLKDKDNNNGNNGNNLINGNANGSNIKIYATYNDLYIGFLNYIGQKRFFLDSYSDNKKMFADLSNYINENKKNGNIMNTKYDKEDFIRILITFKDKFLENRLKISYQKLKKSNVSEIFSCLNEIDQKSELNFFKKYFTEIKNSSKFIKRSL